MRALALAGALLWASTAPGAPARPSGPRTLPSAPQASAMAPQGTDETTDLVNTMLGSLLGAGDVSGPGLQRMVADVGSIPFRRDVPIAFMGREELAAYLREVFDSAYPPATADADRRLLQALDLLPPGANLRAMRTRLLEENVVGFYDERPERRQLFAVSAEKAFTPMNQIVLVHELRHALQDQYQEIHRLLPDDVGDFDDRRTAFISLLEGDATLVMEKYLLARLGPLDAGGILRRLFDQTYSEMAVPGLAGVPGTPPVLRDHLVMPYVAGRDLARAIDSRGGADAMLEAWRRPPESTEQVLHPEKYFASEAPRVLHPRRRPQRGRLLSQGVVGELLVRTLVEEGSDGVAAAGWGGDAFRLWDVDGRTLLVWETAWDRVQDAAEFEEGLRRRFARRWGNEDREGTWWALRGPGTWRLVLRRRADGVELVSSDDHALLDSVLR